jgi:hypothetical protein
MVHVDVLPVVHRNPNPGPSWPDQAGQAIFVPYADRPSPNTIAETTNPARKRFIVKKNLNVDPGFVNGVTNILQTRGVVDRSTDNLNTGLDRTMYKNLGRSFSNPSSPEAMADYDSDRQGGFGEGELIRAGVTDVVVLSVVGLLGRGFSLQPFCTTPQFQAPMY